MISQCHWLEGGMFGLDELQGEREGERKRAVDHVEGRSSRGEGEGEGGSELQIVSCL